MTTDRIAYLNRLLRDYLGDTPAGGPLYKWIHSRDRELFCHIGRLNSTSTKASYEFIPQVWEKRWVLAKWMAPPHEQLWEMQFQGQVGYPRGGYYAAASTPADRALESGAEPTERMTQYVIHLRKQQIALGEGVLRSFEEQRQKRAKRTGDHLDDYLTDKWSNFAPHVHGASAEKFA